MKKSVLASLLALATIFPGTVSMVYAQGAQSGQITIKDPQNTTPTPMLSASPRRLPRLRPSKHS
jgi:hypothetical protein